MTSSAGRTKCQCQSRWYNNQNEYKPSSQQLVKVFYIQQQRLPNFFPSSEKESLCRDNAQGRPLTSTFKMQFPLVEDYSSVLLMDDVQEKNIIRDGRGSIALFIVCVCVCVCVCVDKSQGMTHDAPTKCYTQKKVILPGRPRQLFENLSPYTRTTFKKGLPLLIHWRLDEDINFRNFK